MAAKVKKQKTCGQCGRLGHNARSCINRRPKNFADAVEKKLKSAVPPQTPGSAVSVAPADVEIHGPSDKKPKGEPFADLPSVDLGTPGESSTDPEKQAPPSEGPDEEPSNPGKTTVHAEPTPTRIDVNVDELAKMLGKGAEDAVNMSHAFCASQGFIAFGGPFAKMANWSAQIIIKSQAASLNMNSDEAAAYVLVAILGTNGVQSYRAYKDMKQKQDEEKARAARAERNAASDRPDDTRNGVSARGPDEGRKQVSAGAVI